MAKIREKVNSLSIKSKIFLYLIGFCFVLLVMLWIFQVLLLGRFYGNIRINRMTNSARTIENIIKAGGTREEISAIADEHNICVLILNANGGEIRSADVLQRCKIHKMSYFDIRKITAETTRRGGVLQGVYSENGPFMPDSIITNTKPSFDKDRDQSMIYCREITDKGETIGFIMLNIQLSPVGAAVEAIAIQLQIITVIMVVFSAVLASVISRRVSKPIEKIAKDARQLAGGDYETVFDATGYREIRRLSRTLTRTAEELGRVESLRKDFIANVSHDLRTPLTLIGGYAEIMRDIPRENNAENAQQIIDETHRLSTLVNDLLDMTKLQSGRVPMEKKEYNLTATVSKTVDRMAELLKREGYKITFEYDTEAMITADEARISQCFYNILINAVNYTGPDKQIFVKQDVYDRVVQISVTDTGEGVAEKDIPYVWERYYKNDKNHKRSITGTGLGLSIVRSVIKGHGGMYGVYNTSDKGACFWFSLPR